MNSDWNQNASFSAAAAAENWRVEKERLVQQPMQAQAGQAVSGLHGCDARRSSLREESEKQSAHHYEQAAKAERSAAFFREHPEFDEFIQLIRAGVIGI